MVAELILWAARHASAKSSNLSGIIPDIIWG
jgi:hypothetical protein